MTKGDDINVYYTKKFQSDLKDAVAENPNVPDAIDDLIEAMRIGRTGRYRVFEMPDKCKGFLVIEDKSLNIEGAHGIGGGARAIRTRYKGHILFLRFFYKNQKEKLDTKEKKVICNSLQSVKNGACQGIFAKVEKPLIRSILKDEEE